MNIVHLNPFGDPAGVSWLLHNAMLKEGINSRHIIYDQHNIHHVQQGKDLLFKENLRDCEILLKQADLIHVNNYFRNNNINEGPNEFARFLKEKPFVLHNHGGCILLNPQWQINQAKALNPEFKYLCCGPITPRVVKNAIWVPNICPINNPLYIPVEREFTGTLKICHKIFSRTVDSFKGTFPLEDCINFWLNTKFGYDVHLDVISDKTISECLTQSAGHHICVDNLTQGFIGMSGWEGLSKGQAVIARLHPDTVKAYKKLGGKCPIINVSGMDEMCKVIREFNEDRDSLKDVCIKSREWMQNYYNEKAIVNIYLEIYKTLLK